MPIFLITGREPAVVVHKTPQWQVGAEVLGEDIEVHLLDRREAMGYYQAGQLRGSGCVGGGVEPAAEDDIVGRLNSMSVRGIFADVWMLLELELAGRCGFLYRYGEICYIIYRQLILLARSLVPLISIALPRSGNIRRTVSGEADDDRRIRKLRV